MKILHIIDTIGVGGGAERNMASVVPAMTGHQHRVVHLLEPDGFAPALRAAGVEVERVPLSGLSSVPSVVARLRAMAGGFDVVHTQTMLSDLLGRAAALGRAPLVTSVQTPPYSPESMATYSRRGRAKIQAVRGADALLSTQAARFIAVSRYVRDMLHRRVLVPRSKIRVVYNAIDLGAFAPLTAAKRAEARAELGLSEGDVAIISVGKLVVSKGQDTLLEAMPGLLRACPSARLVLVGDGPLRGHLERRSRELGVEGSVRLLGLRKDVPALLAVSDVFALASHFEGLPLSVAEAMAAGLPCVLSPIDPHAEMQERMAEVDPASSRRMLSRSAAASDWAEALLGLASDRAAREAFGAAARSVVARHFSAEVTAPAMAAVLAEACGR